MKIKTFANGFANPSIRPVSETRSNELCLLAGVSSNATDGLRSAMRVDMRRYAAIWEFGAEVPET